MITLLNRFASAKTIQNEIRNRQESLLQEARARVRPGITATDTVARLKLLGFDNANSVREHDRLVEEQGSIARQLEQHAEYAVKYPGFRMVEKRVMNAVCQKYKLIIGSVERYLGDVPEFALATIEKSGLLGSGFVLTVSVVSTISSTVVETSHYNTEDEAIVRIRKLEKEDLSDSYYSFSLRTGQSVGLLIAAPKKLMRLRTGEEVVGNRIVRRDPIVMIEKPGGYLVITAWDEEGRDPRILNVNNN